VCGVSRILVVEALCTLFEPHNRLFAPPRSQHTRLVVLTTCVDKSTKSSEAGCLQKLRAALGRLSFENLRSLNTDHLRGTPTCCQSEFGAAWTQNDYTHIRTHAHTHTHTHTTVLWLYGFCPGTFRGQKWPINREQRENYAS